ncbi:unnamed protein product [Auanema sp. JU1783]|nr:unnamed protein product [Auanema sp. JU1783]
MIKYILTLCFVVSPYTILGARYARQSYDYGMMDVTSFTDYNPPLAPTDQPTRILNTRSNTYSSSFDPLCTNDQIKDIIKFNIHNDLDRSRQAIEVSLNDKFEHKVWIVTCSNDIMSLSPNKKLYCQTSRSEIWCSAFAL